MNPQPQSLHNIKACLQLAELSSKQLYFTIQVQTSDAAIPVASREKGADNFARIIDEVFRSLQPEVLYITLYDSRSPRADKTANRFTVYCNQNLTTTQTPAPASLPYLETLGSLTEAAKREASLDFQCQYFKQQCEQLEAELEEKDMSITRMKAYIRKLRVKVQALKTAADNKDKSGLEGFIGALERRGIQVSKLLDIIVLNMAKQPGAAPAQESGTPHRRNAYFTPEA